MQRFTDESMHFEKQMSPAPSLLIMSLTERIGVVRKARSSSCTAGLSNTKGYSSTDLAMGFANVRAGTRKRRAVTMRSQHGVGDSAQSPNTAATVRAGERARGPSPASESVSPNPAKQTGRDTPGCRHGRARAWSCCKHYRAQPHGGTTARTRSTAQQAPRAFRNSAV